MMSRKLLCGLTIIIVAAVYSGLVIAQDNTETLVHDEIERSISTYIPLSYDESQPLPLVIALHGFASSGRALALLTDLNQAADDNGFIVVYPRAFDYYWDDGIVAAGWPPAGGDGPIDDVGFINAVIDHMTNTSAIDETQIHLVGLGNGGTMAYRFACESSERLATLIAVSALMWEYQVENCADSTAPPVSTLIIHGMNDPHFPMDGTVTTLPSDDTTPYTLLGVNDTIDFWLDRNSCNPESLKQIEDTQVSTYDDCGNDVSVSLVSIEGGGFGWARIGDYTLNQYGIDFTELITSYISQQSNWADYAIQSEPFDELPRSYHVYVPESYDENQPTPLVIELHGRPDHGMGFAWRMDMAKVADEEGFIIVAPDGLHYGWGYLRGLVVGTEHDDIDDFGFLASLVDDLAVDLNIDRERIYVTGFSNGGFMTQRLACELFDEFAAFASIGAAFDRWFLEPCVDTPPVPMLLMHGTEDPSIEWEGAFVNVQGQDIMVSLSVPDTASYWAGKNRCSTEGINQRELPQIDAETTVYHIEFLECVESTEFYVIAGGGHNIPGVPNRIVPNIALNVTLDYHASEVIWEFFSKHTLNAK